MRSRIARRWRESRGIALIVVLAGITILAAFSSEFTYRSRVGIQAANNLEKQIQAYFHARSGIEIARLVVDFQKTTLNAMAAGMADKIELWRFASMFADIFANRTLKLMGIDLIDLKGAEGLGVDEGSFKLDVESEDARASVSLGDSSAKGRSAFFARLYPLLAGRVDPDSFRTSTGLDPKAKELILNIMDWVDPDDQRSDIDSNGNLVAAGGAGENVDYSRYGYRARNSRMDSVEELRLVEGMTDELFCEIHDQFTVYQTDKINVNDADLRTLRALWCTNLIGDPVLACVPPANSPYALVDLGLQVLDTCRRIKRLVFMPPFANATEFPKMLNLISSIEFSGLLNVNATGLEPLAGVKSKVVRVTSRGWVGTSGWQITGVIDRGSVNWLHWHETGFDATSLMVPKKTPEQQASE